MTLNSVIFLYKDMTFLQAVLSFIYFALLLNFFFILLLKVLSKSLGTANSMKCAVLFIIQT
jgi:hypothetical protein